MSAMADKNIENVKILVGYHFPAKILHDSILTPINAGRALIKDSHTDTAKWLSANTIGDDTGDNISLKNRTYNEMTAIYWAWKNQDKLGYPEAIGYQHYRRHLIFDGPILSPRKYPYPAMFPKYGSDGTGGYLKKVGYSEATVRRMVAEYPCIVSYGYNRRKTIYEQYEHNYMCSGQYIQDLDFIAEYIKTKHPEYSDATDRYIHGHDQFFGNIFILHKVLFDRYCAFMFDVLEAFECRIDPEVRSFSENRFYVSERITGIFVTKLIEEGVAVKKLPVSLVSNEAEFIPPSPSANNAVNVVSAAGAKNLPYLAVTLTSLKEHISSGVQYDIFILHAGISGEELANFERNLAAPENLKLRFINILPLLLELEQFDGNGQECRAWTKFIPAMMGRIFKGFDRILYLDPQLIVLKDIAELCKTDLQNKPLGAVPDLKQFYLEKTRLRSEGKLSEISEIGNRPGDAVLIYDLNALSQEDLSEKYINLLNNSNNLAGGDPLPNCYTPSSATGSSGSTQAGVSHHSCLLNSPISGQSFPRLRRRHMLLLLRLRESCVFQMSRWDCKEAIIHMQGFGGRLPERASITRDCCMHACRLMCRTARRPRLIQPAAPTAVNGAS